jgi:hypothetical protein
MSLHLCDLCVVRVPVWMRVASTMTLCEVLVSRSDTKTRTPRDRFRVIFCHSYEHWWHTLMAYTLERGKDTFEISLSQICYCRLIIDTVPLQLTYVPQYIMSCKSFDLSVSVMNNVESTVVNIYFSEHKPYVSLDLSLPNQYVYVPEYFSLTIMKLRRSGLFFTIMIFRMCTRDVN